MNKWEDQQRHTLENAIAEYFRIMIAVKHAGLSDQQALINLSSFIKDEYDVKVSTGWLATVYYGGADKLWGGRWHSVQAFMQAMHDPRTTDHVTRNTGLSIYRAKNKF